MVVACLLRLLVVEMCSTFSGLGMLFDVDLRQSIIVIALIAVTVDLCVSPNPFCSFGKMKR